MYGGFALLDHSLLLGSKTLYYYLYRRILGVPPVSSEGEGSPHNLAYIKNK